MEFACFSFHVCLFFINFSFKPDTENKILIKNLYECYRLQRLAVYNKVSEQRLDEQQHQQAAGEVRNSPQPSGQRQTQCAYWWKRRHSWVAVAESGRQPQSHRTVREISREAGDPSIISFADYSQRSASQAAARKGALNSWQCSRYAYTCSVCSLRDDKQTYMKTKKAVLSQRWPRDARYISRSWAVAEIWPFEIIQDGCVEIVRIENSAIRSAFRENPTL